MLLIGPLLPLPIRSVTLHCKALTIWIRRPEANAVRTSFVLLNLLKRHAKRFAEVFLAHFKLIASGPDTFTNCDVGILDSPSVRFDNALPLHPLLHKYLNIPQAISFDIAVLF